MKKDVKVKATMRAVLKPTVQMRFKRSLLRAILATIVFSIGIGFTSPALSLTMSSGWNTFWAFGQNFIFPGSVRIGYQQWEGGALAPNLIGVAKNFSFSEKTYSSFGLGLDMVGTVNPAFSASMGYKTSLFWGLNFRAEIISKMGVKGFGLAHGLLGLNYDF